MARNETPLGETEACFAKYREEGDREALAKSLTLAQGELRRVARFYALDPSEEDDVVQATVLTAIEKASSFDPSRRLVPWLIGILLNKIAAARRKTLRCAPEIEIRSERTPMSSFEESEIRRLVDEALEQLPATYRDVLVMHLHEGKGGREIARELDRPQGTIRSQIHRGLRMLRAALPASLALGFLAIFRRPGWARGKARPSPQRSSSQRNGRPVAPASSLPVAPIVVVGSLVAVAAAAWWISRPDANRVEGAGSRVVRAADVVPPGTDGDVAERSSARSERLVLEESTEPASALAAPARMALRVFDRLTGEPVADGVLHAAVETRTGEVVVLEGKTDAEGEAWLDFDPAHVERLRVEPDCAGYELSSASWDRAMGAAFSGDVLPVPIHATKPIGGRVLDTTGSPVSSASVYLGNWALENDGSWVAGAREQVALTDADGRWRLDRAPVLAPRILLRAVHPDHATELDYRERPTIEELWAFEHVIVLADGAEPVEVCVLDQHGNPAPGVDVSLAVVRSPPRAGSHLTTDEKGRVRFRWPAERKAVLLTVRSAGYADVVRRLAAPAGPTVEVRLRPSRTVTYAVVDSDGEPVAGAALRPRGWTWHDALHTDTEGRLEVETDAGAGWNVEVRRPGVLGSVQWRLPAAEQETEAVLPDPIVVRGSVRDAHTGETLDGPCKLRVRGKSKAIGGLMLEDPSDFELAVYGRLPMKLSIRALGYETATFSPAGPLADGGPTEHRWDAELTPVDTIEKTIVGRNGAPVDWAEVGVVQAGMEPELLNGRLRIRRNAIQKLQIPGTGRLAMNRPDGDFALLIVSKQGFALVHASELERGPTIEVEPWGVVEGWCTPGTSPETVRLELPRFEPGAGRLGFVVDYETTVDEDGRFRFPSVPAGEVRIVPTSRPGAAVEAVVPAGESVEILVP